MHETFPAPMPGGGPYGVAYPVPARGAGNSFWMSLAALLLSSVAALVAVAALLVAVRPSRSADKPGYSAAERDEARTAVCAAHRQVRQGVSINTNLTSAGSADAAMDVAIAANARLALFAGGTYLREVLVDNPATPDDLAGTVTDMSNTMRTLGINYLAGEAADGDVQQPLRDALKDQLAALDELCPA